MVCCSVQLAEEYSLVMGGLRASRKLHAKLLQRVMRLPMSFFDSQPSGRLLNRFTKDMEAVDTEILVGQSVAMSVRCHLLLIWCSECCPSTSTGKLPPSPYDSYSMVAVVPNYSYHTVLPCDTVP